MFTDDLLEVHRLDMELIFLGEVPDLVDTVMAGHKDNLGPRFDDLIHLLFSTGQTVFSLKDILPKEGFFSPIHCGDPSYRGPERW